MMMEEEIERTKEEVRGIEEACEKVEEVLGKVIQSRDWNGSLTDNVFEDITKQGDDVQMEDVLGEAITQASYVNGTLGDQNWYEDEKLLALWNGDTS